MKTFGFAVLTVFAALVSIILSEIAVMQWLSVAPFDVTGAFFSTAVVPAHLIIQGIMVSALAPVLRRKATGFLATYVVVVMGFYAFMLNAFMNPPMDILRYELSVVFAIAVWVFINRKRIFGDATA